MLKSIVALVIAIPLVACGDDPDVCEFAGFESGTDGHADPLGAGANEARAGRIDAAQLPATELGMAVWAGGDFVLANNRVAIVIEDVGPSDLYDPWGGRPVGIAAVENGALVRPADFGELFLLTGRYTVMTQEVTVLADGSDGGAAIIRASGFLAPLPFFEEITSALIRDEFDDVVASIDYVLEPGAEHVDVRFNYFSTNGNGNVANIVMHGFMYGERMPVYAPGQGFGAAASAADYLAFVDDNATSYTYEVPGESLGAGISQSGFAANLNDGFKIPSCEPLTRDHARIIIGGPGLDGLRQSVARTNGDAVRELRGVVRDSLGAAAEGVRVHAESASGDYQTRALTGADGAFVLHVDEGAPVRLSAFRRGDALGGPLDVAAGESDVELAMPAAGAIHVVAADADTDEPLPVRVQVLAAGDSQVPVIPASFGELAIVEGRTNVVFPPTGETTLRLPVGDWEVIVSRGYEYEIHREVVSVGEGETAEIAASLERVVDTTGVMCADYHIHTIRSPDGTRTAEDMAASAIGDGLDILARSDHEYINNFEPAIAALGLGAWAFGIASVEMTSMEIWGHFNLLPIEPVAGAVNAGTPRWQRFPSAEDPDVALELRNPRDVFADVRARPEGTKLIINHPVGATNYFGYAGFDPQTGVPSQPDVWDESFSTIEAFNGSGFRANRDASVDAWFGLLESGRQVFAVGASDAHGLAKRGTSYPRTCLAVGTDDPRALTPQLVADASIAGRSTIVGGVYPMTTVSGAGPGETVTTGATAMLEIAVQAPSWIDVSTLELIVDGVTVETIAITPGDAEPGNPAVRFTALRTVDVAAEGSWVIVAAYGEGTLEPVTVDAVPFGVTNPIFLRR